MSEGFYLSIAFLGFLLAVIALLLGYFASKEGRKTDSLEQRIKELEENKRLPHKEIENRENAIAVIVKAILANERHSEYNQAMLHLASQYLNRDRFGYNGGNPQTEADLMSKLETMLDGLRENIEV